MERLHALTFLPQGASMRVPADTSLFEAASWAGVVIDSACGGRGTCGKCRVRVRGGELAATEADRATFSDAQLADGWRLACRARLGRTPSRLEIEVPRLLEAPQAALLGLGHGRSVALAPAAQTHLLELAPPTLEDQASDLLRLRRALPQLALTVPLGVLRTLPDAMRSRGFAVTAVTVADRLVAVEPGDTSAERYGFALDLGTTTIGAELLDLARGTVVALDAALNLQERFGADVISRITHAMESPAAREELREVVLASINELLARLLRSAGVGAGRVYHAVVTGNSTMLHLLLGVDAGALAVAPFAPAFAEPLDLRASEVGIAIHPEGRVDTLPLIGAYVGADTVAGVLATGIGRDERHSLLVDIGTNGEIVLGTPSRILAASAPAGPAFEGAQIGSGMRATDGAIEAVRLGDRVELTVIGGGAPRGICGSGLADAVAGLLDNGLLDASGRLRRRDEVADHPLAERLVEAGGVTAFRLADGVELTQLDIRALQFAKGAIATGIRILLADAGVAVDDLDEVFLAGSFGTWIDPASARRIGLVPHVELPRLIAAGNSSLEGAKMALLSFREQQLSTALAARIEYVELSARRDFNEVFTDSLAFPVAEAVA
jgi:uncharacterized 2Fe-2S/4Fe-4S cluster protein (DUF4445 family)